MNRRQLILLVIVFISCAWNATYANKPVFKAGERLVFRIRYGFITAGTFVISTEESKLSDRKVFHTKAEAKTSGLIDQLYKLHDIYESYYDIHSGFPRLSIMNISEGKYRFYDEVTYNQKELWASSGKRDSIISLEKETFDVVSAIFYFRRLNWDNLSDGDVVELQTLYEKTPPFPMMVVYRGKEEVSIGSSVYRCHKFTPVIEPGKIFKKKENVTVWFSDDKNHVPVSFKLNLLVGSFRIELEEYENLLYPLESKIK